MRMTLVDQRHLVKDWRDKEDRIAELTVQREQSAKGAMRAARALRVSQLHHRLDLEKADRLASLCLGFFGQGNLPEDLVNAVVEYQTQRRRGEHALKLVYDEALKLDDAHLEEVPR